jgi:ABC-type nitrate/sulfonate/bicarbonate transport system permease component
LAHFSALLAYSKVFNALVSPLFNSIRQVPLLGLTPLIALWFGNGEEAKIFIIALALFPLVINTFQGLTTTMKNTVKSHECISFHFGVNLKESACHKPCHIF